MKGRNKLVLLFLALVLLAGGLYLGVQAWMSRRVPLREELLFEVPRGATGRKIGKLLEEKGAVDSATTFRWAIWFAGAEQDLRSGTVRLEPPLSRRKLVEELRGKSPVLRRVTIEEGWPSWRILAVLANRLELDREKLQKLFKDSGYISGLGIKSKNLEGYLFPETYFFSVDASAKKILGHMVERFKKIADSRDLRERAAEHGMSLNEAVTLASIVEREARLAEERPIISAVFHNRLERGMRLEADPTVQYAVRDYSSRLSREDLELEAPYNTHYTAGLPPGPICSPGESSLVAAVEPAESEALYFVARGDGSHVFSRTYGEHKKAVRKYR